MRNTFSLITALLVANVHGQHFIDEQNPTNGHGHYEPEHSECISSDQRAAIQEQIAENRAMLQQQGLLPVNSHAPTPLFNWPLRLAAGLNDPGYHGISNYVDLNAAFPNQLQDHNCGTRTYDTGGGYNHAGTDIYTWPWSWYKMDNSQVEIIAASPGTIVLKSNGNFDRSCATAGGTWNAVYVQHNDGSTAWYGHMKNGSLTAKVVGQTVAQGEYLGVVGSSGNSTGPHLHFEVYNSTNQIIDPWTGPCNTTTATSWWANQRPYFDPAVNALRTHSATVNWGTCPAQEILNDRNSFCPSSTVYFYAYYRDQANGQVSTNTVRRPDNSVYATWNTTASQYYSSSWWYNFYTLPSNAPIGRWTYEVALNGTTTRHYFSVGTQTPVISAATSTTICQGDSVRLSVPRWPGHTYAWKLNGTNITNATDTSYWAKVAGNFTCGATSFCSTITSGATVVAVNPPPGIPTVQQIGITLYTDPVVNHTFQWYLNNGTLAGQTGNAHITGADGAYKVRITAPNGCAAFSSTFNMTSVTVPVKLMLEGPLNTGTSLMNDNLRTLPGFPVNDPYPALGYTHTAVLGGNTVTPATLAVTGSNAIVDWVVIELRNVANNASITASRSALVQRDGDVTEFDGTSTLRFGVPAGSYFLAARHRNHLGVMTVNALTLSTASTSIDLSSPSTPCFGTDARKAAGTLQALWAGDVTFNGQVKYTGSGNDRDPILIAVGSTTPNNTASGYLGTDTNLDGNAKYTGSGNDRDGILVNVGSTTPNNTRVQQLP